MDSSELLDYTLQISDHISSQNLSPEHVVFLADINDFVFTNMDHSVKVTLPPHLQLVILCPSELIGDDIHYGFGVIYHLVRLITIPGKTLPTIPYNPSMHTLPPSPDHHKTGDAQTLSLKQIIPAPKEPWECGICMTSYDEQMTRFHMIYKAYGNTFWFNSYEDLCLNCELIQIKHCVGESAESGSKVTICISCLQQQCEACFDEAREFSCPCSCGALITDEEARLGFQTPEKYKAFLEKRIKTSLTRTVNCLTPDCPYFVEMPVHGPGAETLEEETPQKLECPLCDKSYCLLCEKVWSSLGHICPVFLERSKLKDELKMPHLMYINGIMQRVCPSCKTPYARISGCSHMSCRCGAEFCDVCGQLLDDTLSCTNYHEDVDEYDSEYSY